MRVGVLKYESSVINDLDSLSPVFLSNLSNKVLNFYLIWLLKIKVEYEHFYIIQVKFLLSSDEIVWG